ncbi:MAG: TatD family hydrolase [Kiritimatiellae bacterium]|jgi:TatD DNase family protein|nr:TatD family hydrolase [Kiritimatiellia bacterium]
MPDEHIKYFDAHCHLQDPKFGNDISNVVMQMRNSSVSNVVCNGTSEKDWVDVKEIASKYDEVLPAYGIHPWYLKDVSDDWKDKLVCYIESHDYSSVGETGLDKNVSDGSSYELQKKMLCEHLEIANKLSKPISLHCVKSWGLLMESINSCSKIDVPIVFHSFSGSKDVMKQLTKHNAYFSFSGTITQHNNRKARDVLLDVPLDRLLIETDSPDLLPDRQLLIANGISELQCNSPSNVVLIADFIAKELNMPPAELLARLESNFRKVFLPNKISD